MSGPQGRVWGVGALVQAVGDTLQARYGSVLVRGEVSGFTRAASGHGYFTLKDERGQGALRCAMFRRALSQVTFPVREGMLVEARGQLSVYEARGELQLVVDGLQQAGAGALYEQFLRLKARLEAEGLFDAERKRAIAPYPRRVAIVTSTAAAALRDVVTALRRRAPHVEAWIAPCAVQGAEAPPQIVDALASVAAWQRAGSHIDTVILCRGGGSLEDLWSFNDERVVRAVVACPVPVVCGVGHETDFTLADFAADLRAPTPTAAAELAAVARDDALEDLAAWASTLRWRLHQRLDQQAQRLDQIGLRLSRPGQVLHRQRQQVAALELRLLAALQSRVDRGHRALPTLAHRLQRAGALQLERAEQRQAQLAHRLEHLHPRRVLERGYAWLAGTDGQVVASATQCQAGQALSVHLADGQLSVDVRAVQQVGPGPAVP